MVAMEKGAGVLHTGSGQCSGGRNGEARDSMGGDHGLDGKVDLKERTFSLDSHPSLDAAG